MSELKEWTASEIEEYDDARLELAEDGKIDCTRVYIKADVDKVIALLTDKSNYNEYAYKRKSEELADSCRFYEDELRHHKYKRCLAMANYWVAVSYQCVDDKHRQSAERHHRKWLELAKQFKEGDKCRG